MPEHGPRGPLFLHVGLPKSGTTFLQDMLRQHRRWLRREGLLYPFDGYRDHFYAALDARGNHQFAGGIRPQAEGAWPRLVQRSLAFDGRVVISHEILATAKRGAARRARTLLDEREVHVVVTARDPGRQAVADWQEAIKHGRRVPFRGYVRRAGLGQAPPTNRDADAPSARDFAAQRLLHVIDCWAGDLPPERVHIVTVPHSAADPGLLWRRFGDLLGIADPGRLIPGGEVRKNPRLGVADIEFLRRVNRSLDRRLVADEFGAVAKKLYAQTILPAVSRSEPPVLPDGLFDRADEMAQEWIDGIKSAGYDVRGELEDLRPRRAEGPWPGRWSRDDIIDTAAAATAELLVEITQLRREVGRLERRQLNRRNVTRALRNRTRRLVRRDKQHEEAPSGESGSGSGESASGGMSGSGGSGASG
ncbi:MAG: hypothetical protein ACRDPQ_18340 [Nocardioidaceae bacterium]